MSESTGAFPFFLNYGFHPRLGLELVDLHQPNPAQRDSEQFAQTMENILAVARAELRAAQARYAENANRHRVPARRFRVGQLVYLDARHIQTARPYKKLDAKFIGPFKIVRKVSPHAHRLELPASMRIHPVFYVNKLRPDSSDPIPEQRLGPAPHVEVAGGAEYVVEDIVNSAYENRGRGSRRLKYLVKWRGRDEYTWEPAAYLKNEGPLLETFHTLYPDKPGPRP